MIKTLTNGTQIDINVDYEFPYYASSGNATLIPIGLSWKSLAIMVSGGLDSALLLYLTAKTIKDHGFKTKIRPVSVEVPSKAKSLSSARHVVSKVTELLEFDQMEDMIEDTIPIDQCKQPYKNQYFTKVIDTVLLDNVSQFTFNGDTKNPPEEIRKHFKNDEFRQMTRDNRTTIYHNQWSAAPHAMMDKKDILELYIKFGLLGTVSPYTLSCDENIKTITEMNMPIPCRECWWCSERAWGFTSNGLTKEQSYEYIK